MRQSDHNSLGRQSLYEYVVFHCTLDAMFEVSRNFLALAVISIFLCSDGKLTITLDWHCALHSSLLCLLCSVPLCDICCIYMSHDANMYSEAITIDCPPYNHEKSLKYKFNRYIARIAKRCSENISSVIKCVKLFLPQVLRNY